jgi:phosphoglycolate phosphatase-like HAD superfamily hydrolase
MTKQKIDVEGILTTLAAVRKQLPHLATTPPCDATGTPTLLGTSEEAMEIFELETLADALESFAGEISDSIETAQQQAMAGAMEIYYAAEELAKDPEHAHLIPIVEQMRESYRRDFGREIPER